jgi:hypothetical protein
MLTRSVTCTRINEATRPSFPDDADAAETAITEAFKVEEYH